MEIGEWKGHRGEMGCKDICLLSGIRAILNGCRSRCHCTSEKQRPKIANCVPSKGRVRLTDPMNFRKSSERGGVIFNPKIYIAKFGPLNRAFSA